MPAIKRQLEAALKAVDTAISENARRGQYGAGLASEGYAGGYRDALEDVRQALAGWPPSNSRFWPRGGKLS